MCNIPRKTHQMNLDAQPFEAIWRGTKKVEMRLDGKRDFCPKDDICFVHNQSGKQMVVTIEKVLHFANFEQLYAHYPNKTLLGYKENENAKPNDMHRYYTAEDIAKHGVVALEIELKR